MFCCVDESENIIAIHDDRKVIESYTESIYQVHKVNLKIAKIKKRVKEKVEDKYSDLYLVRYGDAYVQSGYLIYLQLFSDQEMHDYIFAKEILMKILEISSLSKKENKQIESVIRILDHIITEKKEYTPSLSQLKKLKGYYDPYFYNTGLYE